MNALAAFYSGVPFGKTKWVRQCFGFSVNDPVKVKPGCYFGGEEGVVVGFTDTTIRVRLGRRGIVCDFGMLDLQKIQSVPEGNQDNARRT